MLSNEIIHKINFKLFYRIAILGFALSVIIHIVTLFGINPEAIFPPLKVLRDALMEHLGVEIDYE
jgi:hypothetical protein